MFYGMQHIKPLGKGDPLCPLGFHPQVRWPTRCKRCFRDYKEHGGKNRDEISLRRDELTVSSPSLSSWSSRNRDDVRKNDSLASRTWTSSSNLNLSSSDLTSKKTPIEDIPSSRFTPVASSWTSSPNLVNMKDENNSPTVSFTLPRRRPTMDVSQDDPDDYRRTQYTVRRRTSNSNLTPDRTTYSSRSRESPTSYDRVRTSPISDRFRTSPSPSKASTTFSTSSSSHNNSADVEFLIKLKSSKPPIAPKKSTQPQTTKSSSSSSDSEEDDGESTAGTETTETTIVNDTELQEQLEILKRELETTKARCERVEREKSDILLRRLASRDTTTSKTTASEVLKLQQKVNELQSSVEDLKDEKKSLGLRVRELESDLEKTKDIAAVEKEAEIVRAKLHAAETLCEELMDENEDMKKELRELEDEIDEMQDNFREDQADEYTSLKKELEQTAKNCRILSFKLRKAERKSGLLEAEKLEAEKKCRELAGGQSGLEKSERIRHLEQELAVSNEVSKRLQTELEDIKGKFQAADSTQDKPVVSKKKAPMLAVIGKSSSGEKMSRDTLTRGGSQEDPVQLLRDLQDSMEREADLREQLRFAEQEAENLRKKASRVEDDNESLVLQLKKMATKARTGRKTSPTPSRLTPEPPLEKDEGISEEEDPAELRILLELNEQEAAVLRRKVEEMEGVEMMLKNKVKELQDKLTSKTNSANRKALFLDIEPPKANGLYERKITVLEEEMNQLRKKLLEKERECERLNTEIALSQKKPKILQKSKSLDGDQHALDMKRQMQVVEQEASVLRTRNQSLESEVDKLTAENKRLLFSQAKRTPHDKVSTLESKVRIIELEKQLEEAIKKIKEKEQTKKKSGVETVKYDKTNSSMISEIEKLKKDLSKAESEKSKLSETLRRLKEESTSDILQFYKNRLQKKPTDQTTKLQMKNMVEDLEKEIGEILMAFKQCDDELKKSVVKMSDNEHEKLKSLLVKAEEESKRLDEEITKLTNKSELEKKALRDTKVKLEKENNELESKLEKALKDKNSNNTAKEQLNSLNKKIQQLNDDLKTEKNNFDKLKCQLESMEAKEKKNSNITKESEEKSKKIMELVTKIKETDDRLKKAEKVLAQKKERTSKLTKELEECKKTLTETLDSTKVEKETMKVGINKLEDRIKCLLEDVSKKNNAIAALEGKVRQERERATDATVKAGSAVSREITQLRDELTKANTSIEDLNKKIAKAENEKQHLEKTAKEKEQNLDKEVKLWENKAADFEMELQDLRKTNEKLLVAHEKEIKVKEEEMASIKAKSQQTGGKKVAEVKQEYQAKIDRLELALASEKREYSDLTAKYEQLEEEHVITKSKLVLDKENIQGELLKKQDELAGLRGEIEMQKKSIKEQEKSWKKERRDLEIKIQSLEKMLIESSNAIETWKMEKNRLTAIEEEKNSLIEKLNKEQQSQLDQIDHMHKEIEEYRKKMEDYEKVTNLQRSMTTEQAALDREIQILKNRLESEENNHKSEVFELRKRYENRISVISDELTIVQGQVARFKRESDTFKHMLEGAQKSLTDLKTAGASPRSSLSLDDSEELRGQITALEQQISCMEDELSEARLDSSRLKTELVSERSAWEIKISEMTSKLNEMEEDRLLSGRTKIAGLKSRLELAWQKEREDQQRLLQETSTLARDLRQTLFEVERERDKERLESKRRFEQLKKTVEEEQDESKKKLNEVHSDLLELRDAHAKLRTTNEKLRRDKEKFEKEREAFKSMNSARRKAEIEEDRKINSLLQLIDELMTLAPDLFPDRTNLPSRTLPTPPARRKGSKSRETSPMVDRREFSKEPSPVCVHKSEQIQTTLQQLTKATQELRRSQADDERERERARRALATRRAESTESDTSGTVLISLNSGNGKTKRSLFRTSLSLDHTTPQDQIWSNDRDGSLSSIQSLDDSRESKLEHRKYSSIDSRLSGGSTKSEVIPSDKKPKKSLLGKLKKLTISSRSIDQELSDTNRGSDTSLGSMGVDDIRGSKKDLKERLVDMFKKSGPNSSRAGSIEQISKPPLPSHDLGLDSTQRPLRATSVSRTEPSPPPSDGRPAAAKKLTPNSAPLQRKVLKK